MPYTEQVGLDSAWTEFDAQQGAAGVTRADFEWRCYHIRHAGGRHRRQMRLHELASIGTNNGVTLAELIPATVVFPGHD